MTPRHDVNAPDLYIPSNYVSIFPYLGLSQLVLFVDCRVYLSSNGVHYVHPARWNGPWHSTKVIFFTFLFTDTKWVG